MSSQRGNATRSRPQKHKNKTAFSNKMHETNKRKQVINATEVSGCCPHCTEILNWKIQYKKYKPLTIPKKCVRCLQPRTVKKSYHIVCGQCAREHRVCAKCTKPNDSNSKVESGEDHKDKITGESPADSPVPGESTADSPVPGESTADSPVPGESTADTHTLPGESTADREPCESEELRVSFVL